MRVSRRVGALAAVAACVLAAVPSAAADAPPPRSTIELAPPREVLDEQRVGELGHLLGAAEERAGL